MISKLQEQSPLKYGLVRFASLLSPENMINSWNRSADFFDKIVDALYKGAWISSKEAEDAKKQYFQFIALANSELKDEFLLYDQKKIHLNHFFYKSMDGMHHTKNVGKLLSQYSLYLMGKLLWKEGSQLVKRFLLRTCKNFQWLVRGKSEITFITLSYWQTDFRSSNAQ